MFQEMRRFWLPARVIAPRQYGGTRAGRAGAGGGAGADSLLCHTHTVTLLGQCFVMCGDTPVMKC